MERDLNFKRLLKMYIVNMWVMILCGIILAGGIAVFFKGGHTSTLMKQIYLVYDIDKGEEKTSEVQKNTYFDAYKGLLSGNRLKSTSVFTEKETERLQNTTLEVASSCYTITLNLPDDSNIESDKELFNKYVQESEKWMQEKFKDNSIHTEILSEQESSVESGNGVYMKAALGFIVGVILAAFALFVWFVTDTKIRTEEDIVYYTGLECMVRVKNRK